MNDKTYFLYGAEPSYYTAKARAYLRKKGIPFEERSTGHPGFAGASKKAGSTKIPILEAPGGTVVQDTTDIIDYLEPLFPDRSAYPVAPRQRLVAMLFEVFGDECMLKPAMHYRWNFPEENVPYIFREFGRSMAPQMPMDEAGDILVKFADRMKSYLPALGVTEASIPVVEEGYEELLGLLNEHFRLHPYLLGGRPCLADYGMIGPMYAHLARDVYPSSQMKKTAPFVYRWVERMNVSDDGMAEFWNWDKELLTGDEIPETLVPVLNYFVQDYFPELKLLIEQMNRRASADGVEAGSPVLPEGEPGLGIHKVPYRGLELDLGIRHFTYYMIQRPILFYKSLKSDDKASVDALLDQVDLQSLFDMDLTRIMVRKNGIEVFE